MAIFQITLTASPTNQRVVSVEADNRAAAIAKAQQMAKTFPQFAQSFASVTNITETPRGVASGGLTDVERQIMNPATTGMASTAPNYTSALLQQLNSNYGTTDDPNAGQFSTPVNPFGTLTPTQQAALLSQLNNQTGQVGPSQAKIRADSILNTQLGPLNLNVPSINNVNGETLTSAQQRELLSQLNNQTGQAGPSQAKIRIDDILSTQLDPFTSNAPNFSAGLLNDYSRGETLTNDQIKAINSQILSATGGATATGATAFTPNPEAPTELDLLRQELELLKQELEAAKSPAVTSPAVAAATPTEGFLAVLSTIQGMADIAPGGLFDLNALLSAVIANPSLYLITTRVPITNEDGTTEYVDSQVINPVVAQLLDLQASGQTNLSNIELQRIIQTANVDIKRLEGENAVNLAKENNASEQEVARIQAAAQEAVGLAQAAATEKAAQYGATSPFGALAGAGASVDEVSRLAESLARGGMNSQDAIRQALATTGGAYGALGGLTDGYTVSDIAMLARGGLTPEQQLAQVRVQALPGLATISPQSLGGLSAILGQEAVRGLFSPFTAQAQQPQTAQQMNLSNTVQPFSTMGGTMGGTMGAPTPTLGQYERLTPFEQGVAGANIAATGKDIEQSILGVTPGSTAARGSLAAQAL